MRLALLGLFVSVALAQKASISGTVRDAATGQPVPNAQIFGRNASAVSDKDGSYIIRNLEAGTYSLSAYIPAKAGVGLGSSAYRSVSVQAGQELSQIDFKVQPAPEISGRVLDENKEPMQGVQVFLVAREYDSGALRYVFTNTAATDDQGEYRLGRVIPGRAYLVMARKYDRTLPAISPEPADPKLRRRAFATTYYPPSTDLEGALPLVLREGEKREGVDLRLARAASLCLEGTAETPAGPAALRVEIIPSRPTSGSVGDGGFYMGSPGALTGADGKFRICDLAPGEYTLTAVDSSLASTQVPFFAQTRITLRNADVARVKVPALPTISIAGELAWDGDAPKTPVTAKPSVGLRPMTRSGYRGEQASARVAIPEPFKLPVVLIDEYTVDVRGLPAEFYVKDIVYGVQSVLYGTFHAGSAVGNATLRVVIGTDGAHVQVKCADKDNNPIPDANVVLLPADATTESAIAARMTAGQADQNGNYTSVAVPPGKYHVIATTSPVMKSPECIRALMDQRMNAKEITLAPNGQAQVTLTPSN